MSGPAIILMIPQMGENIGAAARAMANFGLSDLRLVAPRDGWPNEKAMAMSAGALPYLVKVSVFETLDEAMADLQHIMATTARRRDMNKPAFTSVEGAIELNQKMSAGIKTGLLFGRERNGLENDEVAKAQAIIHVPTNPEFASINLAQSVLLMAYEIFQKGIPQQIEEHTELAMQKDVNGFLGRLDDELEKAGFFRLRRFASDYGA